MKDGLTQVKELKDKIHEQYIEIQELNKARKFDIEYNKYLQKEIVRLNNIINEIERDIKNLYTYGIKNNAEQKNYLLNRLEGLKEYRGSDKE